ncbi:hypothetical protein MUK42_35517 [Musa troglodytarum]|uniref:Uncharacterized protein n=1 Tax=Musa troglodytarum TaxID=320322 RepID=A0A9E7KYS4_9LILI|nr:hypothetical protein MUK42_35517 [Musa troglodytarum]
MDGRIMDDSMLRQACSSRKDVVVVHGNSLFSCLPKSKLSSHYLSTAIDPHLYYLPSPAAFPTIRSRGTPTRLSKPLTGSFPLPSTSSASTGGNYRLRYQRPPSPILPCFSAATPSDAASTSGHAPLFAASINNNRCSQHAVQQK